MERVGPSSEPDICAICGVAVSRKNMMRHYQKVHPKRVALLSQEKLAASPAKSRHSRRRRRALFFALIAISVTLVSVVAAQVISANTLRMHIHPELSILIKGVPVTIPANIGIDQNLWKTHSLNQYGIGGKSPLLTRDTSGVIHVESNTVRNFTLYEFLAVWGKSVDRPQVVGNPVQPGESACILVNGQVLPFLEDVVFEDGQKITLEIVSGSCTALS